MTDEIDELEASDTLDWDAAVKRSGVANARAVVSVAFEGTEFEAIAACAQRQGLTVTEFVRRVVLEEGRGHSTAE